MNKDMHMMHYRCPNCGRIQIKTLSPTELIHSVKCIYCHNIEKLTFFMGGK